LQTAHAIPFVADLESALIDAYPALVRRLALVLGDADEAEDAAQAAFARALEHRTKFRGGDARAWFYTIGLRLAFNERRRRRSTVRTGDWGAEPAWAMTSDPDLWLALLELDPRHRAALLLTSLDGYTHDEVGRMLGVRTGTVSSWLSRTKEHLRAVLGDEA
jgi:RNA polymerase sigma-70 factor, ECF subfamily